ncbi:Hypothetical predicted protein [Mytilus galloprovincialis]|uniref:MIB/HERC2 domain-containing protein n=1 Tax=Mytilus galloprovincialis TaxID=29158 RepID=A0A8B6GLC5_MYTGA|nr:Hypothetical predicted protein [Mytilus galloprovincialis]
MTTSKEGENGCGKSIEGRGLEKHIQNIDTLILDDTNTLDKVTNQITNLLKKNGRLKVLADNLRSDVTFKGVVCENFNNCLSASQTNNTSQQCISIALGNTELGTSVMDKITSSPSESTVEEDNQFMADEEMCTSSTSQDLHDKNDQEIIQRDTLIEKDHQLQKRSTESSYHKDGGVKQIKQVIPTRKKIRDNGYKSNSMELPHDNRVSYHSKHECFEGTAINNILCMEVEKEEFIPPNIKQREMLLFTQERFRTPRRQRRRSQEEDNCVCKLLDVDQPRTIREWLQYTDQMKAHASARVISGAVKLGGSQDVILVLDTSKRMAGYFQRLKSAALQYVYGIKQQSECTEMDNGIGLATFGRQTRLIQEATNDYDLIIELIGKLTPDGDAPVIGGLLMGLAGVVSCRLGYSQDTAIQAHMIIFTNGSSGQYMLPEDDDDDDTISFQPLRLLAISIASEIRYFNNQSREIIKKKMKERSSYDDIHDDCLDMVHEFINPIRFENMRGNYVELRCNTLQLGDRVRRGPDWAYDDQDLGLPGTVIGQDFNDWIWVEWDHGNRLTYLYDEQKDRYQIRIVNEERILDNEMIAVGCRVVRGQDWKYEDFDGGEGSLGTVLRVRVEGKVVVRWDGTNKGIFKIGHDGLFEVRLCDNLTNNESTLGHMKQNNHSIIGQQNHHNLNTKNEDDPLDYVIPIYSDTSVSAIWEYEKGSHWTQYPSEINTKIEKAYQRKPTEKIVFKMNHATCIIDFQKMIQETPQKKTEMPVRRKELEQHVQTVETQFLEDGSTLEELTKDVSNLINNSSRLNAVVDNVRKYAICEEVIGEKYKVMSKKHPSRIKNQHCKSNTIRNHQECFKGETNKNILTMDLQKEESLPHNIKPEETSMISHESTTKRLRRRSQDEDSSSTCSTSARMKSGLVKIGGSLDVILVLDTSQRMAGYFQKLKSTAIEYVNGIKQQFERTNIDNGIGIAVFGRQTRLIQEATNDYDLVLELLGKLKPEGDAHIIGGLLVGLAGVVSCGVGYMHDTALQPHIIVFTNGSSDQHLPSVDLDDKLVMTFGNLTTLEKAVRTTNGKLIPDDEIIRLILMSKVLKIAMDIASEIRYSNNHSREVIRRLLADKHNFSDRYDDCLDMVPDFINPLRYANKQGKYVELKCNTLKLGERVRRGPDWICSDQDLDLPGTVVGQDLCDRIWVEWDHGQRLGYVFDERTNIYQIRKVTEVRILVDEMIAVGCRVVRGHDWKYGDFDGGQGSLGTVLEVKDKSKVVVRWDGTNKGIFKIGYDGLFEVVLFDDFVNNENSRRYIKPSKHCFARQQEHPNLGTRSDEPLDCVVSYSDILVSAIWEYEKGSQWTKYSSEINTKIEKAYQRKQTGKIVFEMNHTT